MIKKTYRRLNEKITRREFLGRSAAAGLSAAALGSLSCRSRSGPAKQPNLLFVFSDQQSYDMLGCYGNEQILTPNIDRFAADAVRFKHCISSAPMCAPYRGMLMTGQHPLYNGCYANDIGLMTNTGKHFGDVLGDAGYQTGYIGKWHLLGGDRDRAVPPGPARHGFDGAFLSNNVSLQFDPGDCFYWNDLGEKVYMNQWESTAQTSQALSFLDGVSSDDPFALFLSWHPPHQHQVGYDAPAEWMAMYDEAKVRVRSHQPANDHARRVFHGYMAMCTSLDHSFSLLLDKLDEMGVADDTIVVYTSDHGDLLFGYRRPFAKASPEDPSCRVPLIVRWPRGLASARVSDLLVGSLDLMPSLLGLLGLPVPPQCHGNDLSPAMVAGDDDAVDSLPLMGFLPSWRGVYTHGHTFTTENFSRSPRQMQVLHPGGYPTYDVLYDRNEDPWTTRNLFASADHRSTRERLAAMTSDWLDRFEDPFVDHLALLQQTSRVVSAREFRGHTPSEMTFSQRPIDVLNTHGYRAREI